MTHFGVLSRRSRVLVILGGLILVVVLVVGVLVYVDLNQPGVTKANFDRITTGMTVDEVEAQFGTPHRMLMDLRNGEDDEISEYVGHFVSTDGAIANVTFVKGKVTTATWGPSNRTPWQQVRLWLGVR